MIKKTIAIIMIIGMLLSVPIRILAYLDFGCSIWYSNSSSIGRWMSTPSVSRILCGNANNNFPFFSLFIYARSQWTTAGRSSTAAGSNPNADNICYGGTRSDILTQTGYSVPVDDLGVTVYSGTLFAYLDYQGQQKQLKSMNYARVYIIDRQLGYLSTYWENEYKGTFTHELGHAFGWYGHSPQYGDIMYSDPTGVYTIQNRDKNHLLQTFTTL